MNNPLYWKTEVQCKLCLNRHSVSTNTVLYGDLRAEGRFKPDNHYYFPCPDCGYDNILANIPSTVAIEVQNRESQRVTGVETLEMIDQVLEKDHK